MPRAVDGLTAIGSEQRLQVWLSPLGADVENAQCDCACATPAHTTSSMTDSVALWRQRLAAGSSSQLVAAPGAWMEHVGEHLAALGPFATSLVVLDRTGADLVTWLAVPHPFDETCAHFGAWPADYLASLLSVLLANGVVIPSERVDEAPVFEHTAQLSAWLHLGGRCNLKCAYCFVRQDRTSMSAETARNTMTALFRTAEKHGFGRLLVKYAGGEPSLHFAALCAAQEQAEALSLASGITFESVLLTNGLRLPPQQLDYYIDHAIRLTVSLDGTEAYHDRQRPTHAGRGSFAAVVASIDGLLGRGLRPQIMVTVTAQNVAGLGALVAYLTERKLAFALNYYRDAEGQEGVGPSLAINPFALAAELQGLLAQLAERVPMQSLIGSFVDRAVLAFPHSLPCGAGHNYLVVDPAGRVARCQMELDQPITSIAADDPLGEIRLYADSWVNVPVEERECNGCVWRYRCAGGCPRLTWQRTGGHTARSPYCSIYRTVMPSALKLEARRLIVHEQPWPLIC